jgi:transposase-like protein
VYATVLIDALVAKVRVGHVGNRAIYAAIGCPWPG